MYSKDTVYVQPRDAKESQFKNEHVIDYCHVLPGQPGANGHLVVVRNHSTKTNKLRLRDEPSERSLTKFIKMPSFEFIGQT